MKKKLHNYKFLFLMFFAGTVAIFSCNNNGTPLLPNVTGRAGEVVLVINAQVWESESARSLDSLIRSEYPLLPQPEPMFDLVRIGHAAFTNIFKTHRNIILVNISEKYTETHMNVRKNVWAKPQVVLEINAGSADALDSFVDSQREKIIGELRTAEMERIQNYNLQNEILEIKEQLAEKFNIRMVVPPGYEFVMDTTDFAWIRFSPPTKEVFQGLFVYQYEYKDQETFTPEYLIEKRNQFVRNFVPGPSSGSYMTTEMEASPVFSEFMEDSLYVARLNGLWKVENDFMGGPFVSHTILDEKRNRVITVEGFVYNPREKKRNLLRQVEAIVHTVEIIE